MQYMQISAKFTLQRSFTVHFMQYHFSILVKYFSKIKYSVLNRIYLFIKKCINYTIHTNSVHSVMNTCLIEYFGRHKVRNVNVIL